MGHHSVHRPKKAQRCQGQEISPQLGFDYLTNFGFSTLVDKRVENDGTVVSGLSATMQSTA